MTAVPYVAVYLLYMIITWVTPQVPVATSTMTSTKTFATCHTNPSKICPNPFLTPGVVDPVLTKAKLCDPSFHTGNVRNVTEKVKKEACTEYGITTGCPGPQYEIDHLVPIEIGGSNDLKNLWPQPYGQAREKDVIENRLHRLVCDGKISLDAAQIGIAQDWWLMETSMP